MLHERLIPILFLCIIAQIILFVACWWSFRSPETVDDEPVELTDEPDQLTVAMTVNSSQVTYLVCVLPDGFEMSERDWELILAEWNRRGTTKMLTAEEVLKIVSSNPKLNQ